MRLYELLIETTEEDRALISLSSTIAEYIKKYKGTDTTDIGTIGKIFDSPMSIMDDVRIRLESDANIVQRMNDEHGVSAITDEDNDVVGLWYGDDKTMVLNREYIGSYVMKSIITHELRHALDDYKSSFKAGQSKKYATPKNKEHRRTTNDPYFGNINYLAEPAEINARFLQALDTMVDVIRTAVKLSPEKIKPAIMREFERTLEHYQIADLFPEKETSRDYKRLIKRGVDFIEKELKHQQQQAKPAIS